jgi:putative flippase GtrA
VERFLKFATVGILGAVVDFAVLNILINSVLPPLDSAGEPLGIILPIGSGFLFENVGIATTIAFIMAVLSNFVWNRLWTYPETRGKHLRRQLVQFVAVSSVGLVFRTFWVKLTYTGFGAMAISFISVFSSSYTATADDTARLGANIAQLFAIAIVMLWNFFANRYWTYKDVR